MHDRGDAGNIILVGGHDRGHNQNIGDFTDFGGLDIDGKTGEMKPASVAGAVVCAKGNQKQKKKNIEKHQSHPVLGNEVHVDGGHHGEQENAQGNGYQLNNNIPRTGALKLGGLSGTGDDNQAKARGDETHDQQHPVRLFGKILQFFYKSVHVPPPFSEFSRYYIIFPGKSK